MVNRACSHLPMAIRTFGNALVLVLVVTAMAIPWYFVARTLQNVAPAANSPVRASAMVWGGRVFSDRQPLLQWLHARGVAYSVWGGRHPRARATLERAG